MKKLFACAALSFVSDSAHAATIVQTVEGVRDQGFFQPFNKELGTLDNVSIWLLSNLDVQAIFYPHNNDEPAFYAANVTPFSNVRITAAGSATELSIDYNGSGVAISGYTLGPLPITLVASNAASSYLDDAAWLTAFTEGPVSYVYSTSGFGPYYGGDGDFWNIGFSQSTKVILAYSYTEHTSPIPESATWAMMVLGLGLAGAALRRRQTSRLASDRGASGARNKWGSLVEGG